MTVVIRGVGKKYCRSLGASMRYGFQDSFPGGLLRGDGKKLRKGEFWSLKDINLTISKGERIGILGRNGAGKSTLMKLVAGIIAPDVGSVAVEGSIDQMIELTSGFAPSLTGRENARIYAKIKGLDVAEFENKISEIIEFTELNEHIDSPVRFYSSGMKARLGFALATMRKPDVLIVDEALAVGDLKFRLKCYEFLGEYLQETSFILVSHSVAHIRRFCSRAIVLEKGKIVFDGSSQAAIEHYEFLNSSVKGDGSASINEDNIEFRVLSNGVEILDGGAVSYGGTLELEIKLSNIPPSSRITISLDDSARRHVSEWSSMRAGFEYQPDGSINVNLGRCDLNNGHYRLYVMVHDVNGIRLFAYSKPFIFKVDGELMGLAPVQPLAQWRQNIDGHRIN